MRVGGAKNAWAVVRTVGVAIMLHPGLTAALLITALLQGGMQGLLVWTLRAVLRTFDAADVTVKHLIVSAGMVFTIWLLRAGGTYLGEVLKVRLQWRVGIDFSTRICKKLLTLSLRFFERSSAGDLVFTAWQDSGVVRNLVGTFGGALNAFAKLGGLVAVAWILSPKLALAGFVFVPLGFLPARYLGRRLTSHSAGQRLATVGFHDVFLQLAAGVRSIKVNRAEQQFVDQMHRLGETVHRRVGQRALVRGLSRFLNDTAGGVGMILVLVIGGAEVASGRLDWQTLLSLMAAMMAVYGPMQTLLGVYNDIRVAIPSVDRISRILTTTSTIQEAKAPRRVIHPPTKIEMQNVSFAYEQHRVLDSISATFHRGETVGIVGPSGAGKSTLLALLLRLYDPTNGRILWDDLDLKDVAHGDVLDMSAIVLQEPFVFMDTIANNIRLARPLAPMEDVVVAARAANIHEEIIQLPQGYETVLGGRAGGGVSVGQKQRICIASALLKDAPILFLDEATSSLDSVSERAVQDAIEKLMAGRTTFVIAHRLSTLRAADRILVIDRGQIAGFGTHEQLLATCPAYRGPWQSQVTAGVSGEAH